jgi:sortase A
MRAQVLLRRLECALWVAGALASGFCAGVFLEARIYQALQNRRLEEALRSERPQPPAARRQPPRPVGSLIGRLEIPRLDFSAIVLEGSDSGILRVAVGRVQHTADPGQKGNLVLSGHRDTFFRPLRNIREGDQISLVTPSGRFKYVVDWTTIVNPTDTRVLQPTDKAALTLVTCYPFYFVGSAPQRFIVRARQVETDGGKTIQLASFQNQLEQQKHEFTKPPPNRMAETPARTRATAAGVRTARDRRRGERQSGVAARWMREAQMARWR